MVDRKPTLNELGRDLLCIPRWRLVVSLVAPFALAVAFFIFASTGWWVLAFTSIIALSFATYGSISHDLVHRSLRLPQWLNEVLLTAIELLLLRSGRAYRLAHLNHHACYPSPANDPEAAASHGTFWAALRSGPLFFPRLWWWATHQYPLHRTRLIAEGGVILCLVVAAIMAAVAGWSAIPIIYVVLAYLGTWIVPLATAYIPHHPTGDSPLSQTRRFRGVVLRILAFEHLYHLEHHLYPAVPHHHWPDLAKRLDPFLDRSGIIAVRLGV
jgi:beta-carotene hydroxylase